MIKTILRPNPRVVAIRPKDKQMNNLDRFGDRFRGVRCACAACFDFSSRPAVYDLSVQRILYNVCKPSIIVMLYMCRNRARDDLKRGRSNGLRL